MHKFILFFTLVLLSTMFTTTKAQNIRLSNEEMHKDFEHLIKVIKETAPHIGAREEVTGVKIYNEIDLLKHKIDSVKTFEEYYSLIKKALILTQDMHNDVGAYPMLLDKFNKNEVETTAYCEQNYDLDYSPANSLAIIHINGKYYLPNDYYFKNGEVMPGGGNILKVNNIDIDSYIANYNRKADNSIKWDFYNNKFFTLRLYPPDMVGLGKDFNITYKLNNKILTKSFRTTSIKASYFMLDMHKHKVKYFAEQKILYVRIPAMDYSQIDYYKESLKTYKDSVIHKVVIDVRYNGGGNDKLWEDVLGLIINKDIQLKQESCYKNTTLTKLQLKDILEISIDSINNSPTKKIYNEDFFCLNEEYSIAKSNESVNYGGNIYVLVNNRCFSSTLALSAICKQAPSLITVGEPSGYIGGRGITALHFSLPYSKIIFRISPILDAANVKVAKDYYDSSVKLPVELTVDDYIFEINYKGNRFDEFFLLNHDPVFKKVLEH